jgi:hypothetical protein
LPVLILMIGLYTPVSSQVYTDSHYVDSTQFAIMAMKEQAKKWGPNDTIYVPAIFYHNEIVNYKEMEMAWVSNLSPQKLAKFIEEWTRLRNAVYVTYPFAKIAGGTINDINANLVNVNDKKERKKIIKSRERPEKRIHRTAFQSFCVPGKNFNETDKPANWKQLLRNSKRI